jgi:hypothetical protein
MKLEDYLHLYLGCEIDTPHGTATFKQYDLSENIVSADFGIMGPEYRYFDISEVKPLLRPLYDMTTVEAVELVYAAEGAKAEFKMWQSEGTELYGFTWQSDHYRKGQIHNTWFQEYEPEGTRYLLSKHFDLFGLIDAGLAIPRLLNS